jgi:hypothetical protein
MHRLPLAIGPGMLALIHRVAAVHFRLPSDSLIERVEWARSQSSRVSELPNEGCDGLTVFNGHSVGHCVGLILGALGVC